MKNEDINNLSHTAVGRKMPKPQRTKTQKFKNCKLTYWLP